MSEAKHSNLMSRVLSALVLIPPVIAVLWYGGIAYFMLLIIAGVLMMYEWLKLTKVTDVTMIPIGIILTAGTLWAISGRELWAFHLIYAQLFIGCLVIASVLLWVKMRDMAWMVFGLLYVLSAILALYWIRSVALEDQIQSFTVLIWIFLVVWATDVGGYFVGKSVGGPKLAPKVSPKKTWSGLLGGMALAAVVGAAVLYFSGKVPFIGESYATVILISSFMAIVAQAGDLFESAIKREFNMKDSGELIPGHGGILDRVDGLITVSLATALMASIGLVI